MRIYQLVTALNYGDAVGNDILALQVALQAMGYKTAIFAESIDKRIENKNVKKVKDLPKLNKDDILMYHLATGTELTFKFAEMTGRKVLFYHNITPPHFFESYNRNSAKNCADGIAGLKYLADKVDYCLADSEFNKQDLIRYGYKCPIDVLPILIKMDDYTQTPNSEVLRKYADEKTNIIFVGRVAPNKKIEDVIQSFYYYKKYYNTSARLFLVGSYGGTESYYEELLKYCEFLEVKDVHFTGHIRFDEILAYYNLADLFLCMSEHEGFCVPLVEAMMFKVPTIAFDSTAIAETLGKGGVLVKEKSALEIAGLMNKVLTDFSIQKTIQENQNYRLKDFEYSKICDMFSKHLEQFIEGKK